MTWNAAELTDSVSDINFPH